MTSSPATLHNALASLAALLVIIIFTTPAPAIALGWAASWALQFGRPILAWASTKETN